MRTGPAMTMQQFYAQQLSLPEPWRVDEVLVSEAEQAVHVWLGRPVGTLLGCPSCGKALCVYDHYPVRTWRHLDSCAYSTYAHARVPRVNCPEHGVLTVRLPWAEPRAQQTRWQELKSIQVVHVCDVQGTAKVLGQSWDECFGVMERAVDRGQQRKEKKLPMKLGVDEKAASKGHRYFTLVNDLTRGVVDKVLLGRKAEPLVDYFNEFPKEQREAVQAVAMDMSGPFRAAVDEAIPGAQGKIVYDRYHIMALMNRAVDTVRKEENALLRKEGDSILVGTKYLWLYGEERLPDRYLQRFEHLRARTLATGRAYAIKETLRTLWQCETREQAQAVFKRWYFWATHSRLEPVIKAAKTLCAHLPQLLTYFVHRITNATSEGLNSVVQRLKVRACGYRNSSHFITAIYFYCGGLDLYPRAAA